MKNIKYLAILIGILFYSASVFGLTAESDTHPGRLTKSRGVAYYNYNIQQAVEQTDKGERTFYKYDYVIIEGKITRNKIMQALELAEEEKTKLTASDLDDIETEFKAR